MNDKRYKNPSRRSRNIGAYKQGFGQDNRLVIPDRLNDPRFFWERLSSPVAVHREINGHTFTILVEPTKKGYLHACTVDDISGLLSYLPIDHLKNIEIFILRQPKNKEEIITPVWGRLFYWSNMRKYSGPVVLLEAHKVDVVLKWNKSLSPSEEKELSRLKADGDHVTTNKRHHIIQTSIESLRNKQLYRTLPHEIGHYVDYLINVVEPCIDIEDMAERELVENKYWNKPKVDKEAFAHRYVDEFYLKLRKKGRLPFPRIVDPEGIVKDGLCMKWFVASEPD